MHIITYNGKVYVFHNIQNEKEDMFIARCWYIVKNIKKYDYKYLENLSFIWVNQKFLGTEY